MKKPIIFAAIMSLVVTVGLSLFLSTYVIAQGPGNAPGVPVIELIDKTTNRVIHTSTTSGNPTIAIDKVQNYSLRATVLPHDVNNYKNSWWKGVVVNGSKITPWFPYSATSPIQATSEPIDRNGIQTKILEFKAGSAVVGSYGYEVTYAIDEVGNSKSVAKMLIEFTASGPSGGGTNQNNNGPTSNTNAFGGNSTNINTSNSNASDTPANSGPPPNTNTNTNVGAEIGDLDQNLGTFWNPLKINTVPELIASLIRILFVLIGLAAVIVIIIAGFRMVVDNGNESQMKQAKEAITWAIIGLILSLLAFSIVAIVQRIIQTRL